MALNESVRGKRKATDSPPGSEAAGPNKRPRPNPMWPAEWVTVLLNFPSSGATVLQCERLSAMVARAVAAVPDVLGSWDPPARQVETSIDEYLNNLELALTQHVSEASETLDADDPYGTYAAERASWPSSWISTWTLLVERSATSEEYARHRNLVITANDYWNGVLESCEPPFIGEDQTVQSFLDDVQSTLDEAIRDAIDQDDDMNVEYANERKTWPQQWQEARNSLTDNRATPDQRRFFRDVLLPATDDLPFALELMKCPIVAPICGH
ncbi:uncharacterized protein RCC_12214 [Ramularia collo-cygni]|uniref:Uncharacterized protein n=1 Tax=Ramularia collo-cygni TaxID=112498 RepID=A0A2D3V234_9PEZI|nr:uncharacterized protein RCC_12214 [Ramularia collo-cygni]CZT16534.1 uncharacterized protein RCC_12214 [Ramularia collo-cygni]